MPSAVSDLKTRMLELSAPDADGVLRGGTAKRAARTALAMDALAQLWNEAAQAVPFDVPSRGVALAAVGSVGSLNNLLISLFIGRMIDRVPNKGEDNGCKDINDMGVENFDAPVNLMFGSSFKFLDGSMEEVIRKMAEDLKAEYEVKQGWGTSVSTPF